ncbi:MULTISPECIES: beta-ketoacyl synthase N-terminal-like domain-containing protein [Streptomyces]|uniref:Beta-ketoacyl synthase N-terminal-like domain-containing protein n=1 Tax=Streptomyces edwardsiae TaxID=3075527 RepID=A0ABU2Q413_9ACTN|nr:beta-ketoacyl synthase N-terminal-like domain-containing protein [Streptomyces sp. DSM 41636]MDT0398782.1 beta-ketoacyl synthase N-terminal-like domain-containing protein [Streptomyces sp. DSM 41636]
MSRYAIVGISCLFPGARTPEEFRHNLRSGTDSRRDGGEEVFGPALDERDLDPRHRITSRRGGFVTGFEFDPTGYRLDPGRLARLDRIFHWSLYAAREALRDCGVDERPETLARTGLVMGNYSFPTPASAEVSVPLAQEAVLAGLRRADAPELAGLPQGRPLIDRTAVVPENLRVSGSPAAVTAAALGLGGPRYCLDAACSSALYALSLACGHLASGQADLVLAGGVCAPDPTLIHLSFSDLHAYPENGFSQPFDRRSGGIVTGQGAGMVAVKRLADALRDGDRIHAVVDGIGLSNDGSGRHPLVPRKSGQLDALARAYADAGVDPAGIDYLECHATGTPIGDATEAESVAEFFGAHGGVPLLGSVKGNIGHLLTVAGLSSLLKVVLAMDDGTIPPTTGVAEPLSSPDGGVGEPALVRSARAWPEGPGPRRAAVSAFGFGGTNAHVVLSDATSAAHDDTGPAVPPALDVVGLGAHFGSLETVEAFERAVHRGDDDLRPLPEQRWRGLDRTDGGTLEEAGLTAPQGAFVDGVEVDPVELRVPPSDLRIYNPQHALMTKVADEALRDAGYRLGAGPGDTPDPRRVAVVVVTEIEPYTHARLSRHGLGAFLRREFDEAGLELTEEQRAALAAVSRDAVVDPIGANEVLSYIGNIMAGRISSRWNLTGPSFTLSADGAGTAEALEVARLLLLDPDLEAVLVGAVDLAGSAENLLTWPELDAGAGLSFNDGGRGRRVGEGAGALVVTRADAAGSTGRVHARIDGTAVRYAPADGALPGADAGELAGAARAALAQAGVDAAEVGYVEAHADGTRDADRAEIAGLAQVYRAGAGDTALGSVKAQLGDTGCASGMAGLLRAVLCLRYAYLPGTRGWLRPADELADAFEASAFHVPETSRPWLRERAGTRRHASVSMLGAGGSHAHLVLSSVPGADRPRPVADWYRAGGPVLLAVGADTPDALVAEAGRYRALLDDGADPHTLAREAAGRLDGRRLRAVLVGHGREELVRQLELMARDVPVAHAEGREWATPSGSFFTPRPLGPEGRVALVYPGAFNSYPGLGADLFRAFPALLDRFEGQAAEPARMLRAAHLYPRSREALTRRDLMGLEERLGGDVPFMLATGTSFAILYTALVREVLGVTAHGGFGYSLGESSMLFATGGWDPAGRSDSLISDSPVFQDRLCGPRRTVREAWGLPEETPDPSVWASHVLLSAAEPVREALTRHDRVFLTHVNTPGELVIAGDPAQCRALIEEVGCRAARSPVNVVMHCPVVDAEFDGLARLNDYPTGSFGDLELFSAYDYEPLAADRLADSPRRIATTLRSTIDFPRLVHAAYERGYRYFIEVGPGATCSRWIRDTLGDAPHMAACVDRRGVSATTPLAQLVARLVGHGVPVDLSALLGPEPAARPVPAGRRLPTTRVGLGEPVPDRVAREAAEVLSALRPGVAEPSAARPEPAVPVLSAPPEVPAAMPADPTLEMSEVITFDGEPATVLPWTPPAPAPAPAAPPAPTAPPRPAAPSAPAAARTGTGPAADLVRELRREIVAAHGVVMETHRVLQAATLDRTEALLGTAAPAVPRAAPAPVAPAAVPPPALPAPSAPSAPSLPPAPRDSAPDDGVVWDEAQLLEFATGSVAEVFGPEFAEIDTFKARVRLPAPPYHFVTRVTELDAKPGVLEPARITTEYDVPEDAWYAVDGGVPPAVTVESGQCDLLLVAYLGIDFRNKGERVYRLLDSSLIFRGGLPTTGQTLRYEISIDRFVHQGDTTIFFFSYDCYADGELILELRDACAGFFSKAELDTPLGVVITDQERARRAALPKGTFKPLAYTGKNQLDASDLELLAQGRPGDVFGPEHAQDPGINPALRLPDARLRMVDEVVIDRKGGPCELGAISAVKRLEPDAWYFTCHFPDDPVLAGSLIAEGAIQMLQIYLMHQGMHLTLPDARFQTVTDRRIDVQVRGQVTPKDAEIRYEVEVTELTLLPRPTVIADVLIHLGDKPVVRMQNLGLQIVEKPGTPYRPETGGVPAFLGRRNRSGEAAMINELHLAHSAKGLLDMAMGPEFEIYRDSRAPYIPNGDFQFVDRVMSLTGTRGDLSPGSEMVTEYDSPDDAWYYRQNSSPYMPNCVYMESSLQAAIFLGYYLGATLREPREQYAIRNLDGRATLVKDIDLRGKTVRHHSKLLMTSVVSGAVLQNFSYELSADGEVFYTGESLFGYFSESALANQVGLDSGTYKPTWLEEEKPAPERVRRLELGPDAPAFRDDSGGGLRLPGGRFDLVDRVDLVADGGRHGAGYLHGHRGIRPDEWYFDCHFHRDPVMPGSLGVEAVLQALRLFVLDQDLARGMTRPRFAMATDVEMSWKYRGQILRDDRELFFDVHVKEVREEAGRLLLIADADLWKPGLRIYELTDVAIEVRPDAD